MLYVNTYMWSLKNKTKKNIFFEKERNRLTDTENKHDFQQGK